MDNVPWLTVITFLPALAAVGMCFVQGDKATLIKRIALVSSLVVLGLAAYLFVMFDPASSQFQFEESASWIGPNAWRAKVDILNIRYAMGMDGLALSMVALTALLIPLCVVCSWNSIQDRAKGFFIALMLLQTGMIGVFLARDLFLFYVFWEVMLIPMLLLIGVWGGPRRIYASVKFMIYTMAGSLLMFVAILYCYFQGGDTFSISELPAKLHAANMPFGMQCFLFLSFAFAFAIKVPLFPFHTWLPDAHVEAPTAGSVILAGVLLKMGAYGFLRFAIPFFPEAAIHFAPMMLTLAVVSIVFGALMSMAQTDIKKLIAYSSVSHLGFVMLGIFSFTLAGGQGAVLQMVNHGLSTGALFLMIGMIYDRTHKRGTDDFGGLAEVMPRYATAFMIVTLASIGLPGLNGFVGEFLVLKGAFETTHYGAIFGSLGVILGAVYMLKLYRDMFWGKVAGKNQKLTDLTTTELATLAPLVILIFVLGFLPQIILKRTEPSVRAVMQNALKSVNQGEASNDGR